MKDILALADQLYTGETAVTHDTLFGWHGELVEVASDTLRAVLAAP